MLTKLICAALALALAGPTHAAGEEASKEASKESTKEASKEPVKVPAKASAKKRTTAQNVQVVMRHFLVAIGAEEPLVCVLRGGGCCRCQAV